MLLALVAAALAAPLRVGPGTGDHPLRTEISDCGRYVVAPFYREGPPIVRPPHARVDFAREIADSARRALPVERVEP